MLQLIYDVLVDKVITLSVLFPLFGGKLAK